MHFFMYFSISYILSHCAFAACRKQQIVRWCSSANMTSETILQSARELLKSQLHATYMTLFVMVKTSVALSARNILTLPTCQPATKKASQFTGVLKYVLEAFLLAINRMACLWLFNKEKRRVNRALAAHKLQFY